MSRHHCFIAGVVMFVVNAFTFTAATAAPIVIHDEAIHGDLSNRSGAPGDASGLPTDLGVLTSGPGGAFQDYRVIARTDVGAADFFTIEIGTGNQLQSILFTDITFDNPSTGDNGMFLGISSGDTFANSRSQFNNPDFTGRFGPQAGDNWLGGALIGRTVEGTDILPTILGNANFGLITLSAPLGPGEYTFAAQQTGAQNAYTFDFGVVGVTAIPEPSTWMALTLGGSIMAWRQCRRRSSPMS